MIGPAAKTRRRPQQQTARTVNVPPPDGINVADPASGLPATDAVDLVNLIRGELGLRPRLGYREHVTNIGTGIIEYVSYTNNAAGDIVLYEGQYWRADAEPTGYPGEYADEWSVVDEGDLPDGEGVRTVVPYAGSTTDSDRLFAVSQSAIIDATSSGRTPTNVFTLGVQDGLSGWGNAVAFTTAADKFIVYCDEANGYLLYTESTGTWAEVQQYQIDGADPRTFAHVCAWKNRLLFTERDSARMWYLDVGVVAGQVHSINFGSRFKAGGSLVGCWNWTGDGGAGIDDHLVAISSAGDVVIYNGTNPSDSTAFALRGVWYAGAVPAGRRIASDVGGELLILTSLGILPLSALVAGSEKLGTNAYTTRKIAPLVASAMERRRDRRGWDLRINPGDNSLMVVTPTDSGHESEQFVMALTGKGWSRYRGLPILSAEAWRGKLYFGTEDGRVCVNDGGADAIPLDGSSADAIAWGGLTGFSDLGTPGNKRVQMVRPSFVTEGTAPSYSIEARYDVDTRQLGTSLQVAPTVNGWGTNWGEMVWSSGVGTASDVIGATGIGRYCAIAFNGATKAPVAMTGFQVTVDAGGIF